MAAQCWTTQAFHKFDVVGMDWITFITLTRQVGKAAIWRFSSLYSMSA